MSELRAQTPGLIEELFGHRAAATVNNNPLMQALGRYLSRPAADPTQYTQSPIDGAFVPRETTPGGWLDRQPKAVQEGVSGLGLFANFMGPGAKPMPRARLPMDAAARSERADAMGFYKNPVYHGTALEGGKPFSAFDLARGGHASGSQAARLGVSASMRPDVANEFATLAASRGTGDPAVMPLRYRSERRGVLTLDGSESNQAVAATVQEAFSSGYDSVVFRNYRGPTGQGEPRDIVMVKDPAQLRSVNAAFDPAKRDSSDLMASRLLPLLLAGGAAATHQDE